MRNHFSFSNIVHHWLYCFRFRLGPYTFLPKNTFKLLRILLKQNTALLSTFRMSVRPHLTFLQYICHTMHQRTRQTLYIQKPIHPGHAFQTMAPHTTKPTKRPIYNLDFCTVHLHDYPGHPDHCEHFHL